MGRIVFRSISIAWVTCCTLLISGLNPSFANPPEDATVVEPHKQPDQASFLLHDAPVISGVLPKASREPQSVVEKLGLRLDQAKEIVVLTFNDNIGDSMIMTYGYLEELHRRNPGAI